MAADRRPAPFGGSHSVRQPEWFGDTSSEDWGASTADHHDDPPQRAPLPEFPLEPSHSPARPAQWVQPDASPSHAPARPRLAQSDELNDLFEPEPVPSEPLPEPGAEVEAEPQAELDVQPEAEPQTAPLDGDFNRPFEAPTPQATEPEATDAERTPSREEIEGLDLPDVTPKPELDMDEPPSQLKEGLDEAENAADDEPSTCQQIYNDRNCCDENEECDTVGQRILSKTIREISLDIAPPYAPLTRDRDVAMKLQEERLRKSGMRVWKDRQGQQLAQGRFYDLRSVDVIVQETSGELKSIRYANLGEEDRCFVAAWWNFPTECRFDSGGYQVRDFTLTTFTWTASALCHKPLYFEDVQLERYGHSTGPMLQPFMSGAHFFSSLILLPYNVGLHPPTECQYDLGYYQPGSCAPWLIHAFPLSRRALLSEATAILGLYAIF